MLQSVVQVGGLYLRMQWEVEIKYVSSSDHIKQFLNIATLW